MYATILAPFVPSLTAKVHYMLGCKTDALNGEYSRYRDIRREVMGAMDGSVGLR